MNSGSADGRGHPGSTIGGAAGENGEAQAQWSGSAFIAALQTATAVFQPRIAEINALNVFPVPDGDTGTNMFLTLQAAVREAEKADHAGQPRIDQVASGAAQGALMGARGNSGVILYQIFAGIAEGFAGASHVDGTGIAAGLRRGATLAYQAVTNPVEGTMLTIIRAAADAADKAAQQDSSMAGVLGAALEAGRHALQRTPELLDILRQAGVVDAGGQGLVVLLEGLLGFAHGTTLEAPTAVTAPVASPLAASMAFLDQPEITHGVDELGYCTNFILTGDDLPVEDFRTRMNEMGTSAVVVGDKRTLKVHVHSEHPGMILEAALSYGELHHVQIDNMSAQTQQLLVERREATSVPTDAAPPSAIATIAVASGEGLATALRGMGAAAIVQGGPTFNPSTEEILLVVQTVPQDQVILLPNDPNVIPTAQQVQRLTAKAVRVVPSRSVPEGISALAAFNFHAALDENVEHMTEALGLVRSLALTRATRPVEIGGIQAEVGQFIGLLDGELRAAGDRPEQVVLGVLAQVEPESAALVTLFVGEPAEPGLGEQVATTINDTYPDLTVEVVDGGQPHYELHISVE